MPIITHIMVNGKEKGIKCEEKDPNYHPDDGKDSVSIKNFDGFIPPNIDTSILVGMDDGSQAKRMVRDVLALYPIAGGTNVPATTANAEEFWISFYSVGTDDSQ